MSLVGSAGLSLSVVRNPAVYSALEHLDVLPVVPQRVLLSQYCQPIVDLSAFLFNSQIYHKAIDFDVPSADLDGIIDITTDLDGVRRNWHIAELFFKCRSSFGFK